MNKSQLQWSFSAIKSNKRKIYMSSQAVTSVACRKVLPDNILYMISKNKRKGSNAKYGAPGKAQSFVWIGAFWLEQNG